MRIPSATAPASPFPNTLPTYPHGPQRDTAMLVAMAGLPGTGKSTLATRLASDFGGVVLSKDVVRATLFPPPALDYSRDQDDIAMAAVFAAAGEILRNRPGIPVFLDGRTFSKRYQLRDLVAALGVQPRVIECVCEDAVAKRRIEADAAAGAHPAGNRTFALYQAVKAAAESIDVPRLTLDTGRLSFAECVRLATEYLGAERPVR